MTTSPPGGQPARPDLSRRTLLGALAGAATAGSFSAALAEPPPAATPAASPAVPLAPRRLQAPLAAPIPLEVQAVPTSGFDRTNAGRRQFGKLEFRGGLVLSAAHKDFGGWSGILTSEDGRRLLAISDQGTWMTAEIVYEGNRPIRIAKAMLGDIGGMGGSRLTRGRDKDSESLTLLDGTLSRGTVLIGFERNHRIGRFPVTDRGLGPPLGYVRLPAEAKRMSMNKGFEAVTVIRGGPMKGSVLAFSEEMLDSRRNHTGWIWPGGIGGEPQRLGLVNIEDFAVTDVGSLPDGSLIMLERKFRWTEGVKMRLRQIPAAMVRGGALLDGEVLLSADMRSDIDNMEGLALSRDSRGQTVLTIISDNNFNNLLQRTLLLQFAITPAQVSKAGARAL